MTVTWQRHGIRPPGGGFPYTYVNTYSDTYFGVPEIFYLSRRRSNIKLFLYVPPIMSSVLALFVVGSSGYGPVFGPAFPGPPPPPPAAIVFDGTLDNYTVLQSTR